MCKQEIASQAELFSPPSCSLLGAQVALAEPEANLARKIGGMSDIPKARQLVLTVADQADLGAEHHQMLVQAIRLMYRRPLAKPRAPVTSAHIGPEEAAAIRALATHPTGPLAFPVYGATIGAVVLATAMWRER